jgi:hypothetical protein
MFTAAAAANLCSRPQAIALLPHGGEIMNPHPNLRGYLPSGR